MAWHGIRGVKLILHAHLINLPVILRHDAEHKLGIAAGSAVVEHFLHLERQRHQ